jgi:hypothetical protein
LFSRRLSYRNFDYYDTPENITYYFYDEFDRLFKTETYSEIDSEKILLYTYKILSYDKDDKIKITIFYEYWPFFISKEPKEQSISIDYYVYY